MPGVKYNAVFEIAADNFGYLTVEQAWDAAAQSELRNAAAAATSCSADNDGDYTGTVDCHDVAVLDDYGWTNDSQVTEDTTGADDVWSATAVHENGGATYEFTTEGANAGEVTEQGAAEPPA